MAHQRPLQLSIARLLWPLAVGLGGVILFFQLCAVPKARAVDLTVTNLNDSGPGSLRQTILNATAGDTVVFATQLTGTLSLQSGELVINKNLTIIGPGASLLSLSGTSGNRVITVAAGVDLKLVDLTIRSGSRNSGLTLDIGGGIYNNGRLSATRVAFVNNVAFWTGGALYNSGTVVVDHGRFEGNGSSYGSAITNGGVMTLTSSTVSGSSVGGGTSSNGVIENLLGATLYLANTTVANNASLAPSGANSTIANFGDVRLENVTVAGNQHAGTGAALYQDPAATGAFILHNSLVAANSRLYAGPADCAGTLTSADYNLIQSTTGCTLPGAAVGLITGVDPALSTLGDHGGFGQTQVPDREGPAVGAGDPVSCLAMDQRDRPRPSGAGCDLGAVEYQAAPLVPLVVTTAADNGPGSLRQTVAVASAYDDDGFTITFAPQISGTLTFASGQIDITRSMTIAGPGSSLLNLSGGGTHRLFQIGAGVDVRLSGLTLSSGNAGGNNGGAILTVGRLTLTQSRVINSTAANGGGIAAGSGGGARIIDSSISGNSATSAGGGVYVLEGSLDLMTSTVSSNQSNTGAGLALIETGATVLGSSIIDNVAGGVGGGVLSNGVMASSLNLSSSTIAGNTAQSAAGLDLVGPADLANVTISGNAASGNGGGLYARDGDIVLGNVTVTDNVADSDSNSAGDGGGVWIATPFTTLTAMNSLIAGNVDRSSSGSVAPDCFGGLNSYGYNLIEQTAGCTLNGTLTGVITNTASRLAPLQDAGGPTQVHPLLDGSPAYNAGNPATPGGLIAGACLPIDQRGVTRPQDGRCDIGAFEGTWRPLTTIQLSGPDIGVVGGAYTFTADVGPITATQPVAYTWSVTGASAIEHTAGFSDTLDLTWGVAGTYSITVAADNLVTEPLLAGRSIRIVDGALTTVQAGAGGTLVYTPTTSSPTTLSIPAGALTDTTTLLLATHDAANMQGFAFAGHAFSLDAYQNGGMVVGFTFAKPVTMTVGYTDADLGGLDEQSLRLTTWNGSAWVDAATTCSPASTYVRDLANNRVSVAICHLSDYALFGQHHVFLPTLRR